MDFQITGKNTEISEQIRQYIERKLGKLSAHLPSIAEAQVEISRERTKEPRNRYVVQATLNVRGTLLRGEVRSEVLATAIDGVAGILDRQIERYKGKLYEKGRRASAQRAPEVSPEAVEEAEASPRIVKEKRFPVKPMAADEALEQMELLGHDFFIFINTDNDKFSVIYRRHDGDYGLIEPA